MRFLIRVSWLLVFSIGYSQTVLGQGNPDKIPAAVDEVFADVAKPGSPGCTAAIARDGKLLYAKGYGLANVEQNVGLTPDSVFDIGSTSKQFSAASILLLEKQGKLSVNDDVRKYIPELPDYGKKITILNLLNHTSGLRDYLVLFELAGVNTDSVTTDEEALALIARQKALNFGPGTEWLYSNSGFFLLSVIVKRASGQSLREFAAENIFQPLNMSHTLYRDSHTLLVPNRALAYDPIDKGTGYTFDVSYFEQTGDGAVHTSVGDLLKWDENFYTAQVGGKPFLAELQEPGNLNNGKTLDYAKGLFISKYRGLNTVSHGGSWGGYRAELLRFPDQHFSVVCLCNRSDVSPERRAKQVADIYLASVLKEKEPKKDEEDEAETKAKPEVPVAAEELKKLAGDYWSDELGVAYRLRLTNDKLVLDKILLTGGIPRSSDSAGKAFVPVGKNEFQLTGAGIEIRFQLDAAGQPVSFTLDAGRTKGMIFRRTWDKS
jgi:CubicO group peptidase (beta-lactamase class C family)